jgi:hypothetical protein
MLHFQQPCTLTESKLGQLSIVIMLQDGELKFNSHQAELYFFTTMSTLPLGPIWPRTVCTNSSFLRGNVTGFSSS